ncbi:MAG TPA: DUF3299 domain-containing protein [Pirellulaceae bacterium]|nr:DUF3299 domain-containing protein [Pirellulaceae bacterium]
MEVLQEVPVHGRTVTSLQVDAQRQDVVADPYFSVSKSAIAALTFGILAPLGIWAAVFLVLPLLAICFGALGLINIRRFPSELYGRTAARVGLVSGLLCLGLGIAWHSYVYATEVPEGYQRVNFYELRPNTRTSNTFYAEAAEALDGQKVFMKGYVRPNDRKTKLKSFILVGDFGSCCFGGNPKMTDIVGIRIMGDQTVDYSWQLRRVTGTFRLHKTTRDIMGEKDVPRICYEIEADNVW